MNLLTICLKILTSFTGLETLGHKLAKRQESSTCRVRGGEGGLSPVRQGQGSWVAVAHLAVALTEEAACWGKSKGDWGSGPALPGLVG